MKRIVTIIMSAFMLTVLPATAQNMDNLWATGSAVPGGVQKLTKRPDGQFRFAGPLNAGELKIMNTETYIKGTTYFLRPQMVDSYLINYGLAYALTTDSLQPGWVVSFQEDTYRFLVNVNDKKVTGELMLPWNEVLIAGSAFLGGSDDVEWKRDNMLSFVRDHDNPYIFTWTGELGYYDNVVEPGCFKLEGQMTWGPRELHPYTDNEDITQSTQVCLGGPDRKWKVGTPGRYRITVDLFNETVHGELLTSNTQTAPEVSKVTEISTEIKSNNDYVYDLQGRVLRKQVKGLNLVRQADGKVRKVWKAQ